MRSSLDSTAHDLTRPYLATVCIFGRVDYLQPLSKSQVPEAGQLDQWPPYSSRQAMAYQ